MAAAEVNSLRTVELRRAGVSFEQIAERLGYDSVAQARAVYEAAVKDNDDIRFSSDLEAARLERLHTAVWPAAAQGDVQAIDRVIRLGERREKLLAPPKVNGHEFRNAFDASVQTSTVVTGVDAALIEAGRKIADRVDVATALGEGIEVTKALYLVPHMVNILRELLATPASRVAAGITESEKAGGKLAQLRAVNSNTA